MNAPAPEFSDEAILPAGFRAAGLHAGVKAGGRPDMALLLSDAEHTAAAGLFTTNKLQAAPVKLGIERLQNGQARAIIINSGNANACTGEQGMTDALEMCSRTAEKLGLSEDEVLVSSTGSIGKFLNMVPVRRGIDLLAEALSTDAAADAANAILTTDTRPKSCHTRIQIEGREVTLAGICKGAGMIEPNMATMLSYILTDAAVDPEALKEALLGAGNRSFNRISIDGDTSTNDSVIALANGVAGNRPLKPGHPDWNLFQAALDGLLFDLAMKIVWDGEGMTRFFELRAVGAASDAEADQALRAVANSFLVKTGWAGSYPAWSRVADVLGYCGVEIDPDGLGIEVDGTKLMEKGMAAGSDPQDISRVCCGQRQIWTLDLGTGGEGSAVLYTCDCTEEYVRINMF